MNHVVGIAAPPPAAESNWPVTNCYIDAWLLLLRAWELEPLAGLGVTVTQAFEGDQFTFFKYLHEDLERLYGIVVGELSIWGNLEDQVSAQVRLDRLVLVEVDGYYLPDTRATSYRTQHTKTTIGIDTMDLSAGQLTYYHNAGRYELTGEDYAGVFHKLPQQQSNVFLPPYVEFVKRRWPPLRDRAMTDAATELLRHHLRRRPERCPIAAYRAQFAGQMDWLIAHPDMFHEYAFATFRQLGANFELLGRHLGWLEQRGVDGLTTARAAAAMIGATAKAMQFKAARIASRHRFDPCDTMFDTMQQSYATLIEQLTRVVG